MTVRDCGAPHPEIGSRCCEREQGHDGPHAIITYDDWEDEDNG